jgi:3-oxoacid CoA-transferase B subunit
MSPATEPRGRTRDEIAARVAADLVDGWYVNLGLGLPTLVGAHVPSDIEVMLHTENGLLGIGAIAQPGEEDPDLCDASKNFTTLRTGASAFDSAVSFAMIRSGRIDAAILGGLQVSGTGDLANWYVPNGNPGVGGAMDLAVGAGRVWVVMQHTDRAGRSKLVTECDFPLTGAGIVDRVYTDLAVFELQHGGLVLVELAPGVTLDAVRSRTEAPFDVAPSVQELDPSSVPTSPQK